VLHIHLRFYSDARLGYAGPGADANSDHLVATVLTTIIGWHRRPGKYLGWSHQIGGCHSLKDYDSDESRPPCLINLSGATEECSGAAI